MPLTILRDDLAARLDQERISQRFLAGQINFCTLMPMRSIPFKVVCLLGMNDGVYPRTLPPLGFDLMAQQVKRGDRSRRDDDRYLFPKRFCPLSSGCISVSSAVPFRTTACATLRCWSPSCWSTRAKLLSAGR